VSTAPWITYRPELKVLDCTVRDGGLINNHQFSDDFVRAIYQASVDAGLDYMEIGYKNSKRLFSPDEFGDWKFCDEEAVRRVVGDNPTDLKLSAMIDAGKADWSKDVLPKSESVIDLIRVACYIHQISEAVEMVHDAAEKGYEVTVNIMAISVAQDKEIDQALEVLIATPASTIIVVDSFGALYAEQVELLVKKYRQYGYDSGKEVGIHAHNNQQLAFANTIEAIIHGANLVDASIGGLGRGAGNCPLELILGFLRNPKFHSRPVFKALQEAILPIQREIEWGPHPQYIISGQLNQHPREAMAARADESLRDDLVGFYDRMTSDI
jgi:4-hydroxy 2-oxovalerate aldolase